MSIAGAASSTSQFTTLPPASFTSMKKRACGLIQSIFVTGPEIVAGLFRSYCAANEWWARSSPDPMPAIIEPKPAASTNKEFNFIVLFRTDVVSGVAILADELDQFRVEHNTLVDSDGKRLGVGLGIVDGHIDFEVSEIGPSKTFDRFSGIGQRVPVDIQPAGIAEVRGLHNKRVTLPLANRVTIPPGIGVFGGQGPTVGEDLAKTTVSFVNDVDHSRSLDDFSWLTVSMKLHVAHRQTMRIGVVFAVVGHALLHKVSCPRLQRQTFLESRTHIAKCSDRRRARRWRWRRWGRLSGLSRGLPDILPDSREVRLSVGRSWCRCRQVRLSVRPFGNTRT